MDTAAQLALISKAKKVFGNDGTFLSFPVSPLPFSKRQLDFFSGHDADDLRQSMQNLQAFSTLVNLIPGNEAWIPAETHFLWDVYDQVLKADYAVSSRTSEEEQAYQKAFAYLRVAGADGLWGDSAALTRYKEHRDAYLLAEQKYLSDKSTAECASDLAARKHWHDIEDPRRRTELDTLQSQWIVAGNKNEVEAEQSKVVKLGARSPIQTWADWNSRFNHDIDTVTGASDTSTFYPSFFAPDNALADGAWKPFKLSQEEVRLLLEEAPAELRRRFSSDGIVSSVKSLTFEFSSAVIVRPWFVSDAFRARFWRLADTTNVISDGGTPPRGACPAYVAAIVFARNVAVEEQDDEPRKAATKAFDGFQFAVALRDQNLTSITGQAAIAVLPPNVGQRDATTSGGHIWKYVGPPGNGWQELDNTRATVDIAADGAELFQLNNKGGIWKFTGAPLAGWQELDNNPATRKIVTAGGNLYQLQEGGTIWKYVPPPAAPPLPGTDPPMSGWQVLDSNPATVDIAADGGDIYQLHNTGRLWKYSGNPTTGWQELDNNPATRRIVAAGGNVYQIHQDGTIWQYVGPPMTGWQVLDSNPATVDIAADAGDLYQLHNTGRIWRFTGAANAGWEELDNNPATRKIVAAGGRLYQLHQGGGVWQYVGPPMTGWQALDNNPATVDIAAGGGDLYQRRAVAAADLQGLAEGPVRPDAGNGMLLQEPVTHNAERRRIRERRESSRWLQMRRYRPPTFSRLEEPSPEVTPAAVPGAAAPEVQDPAIYVLAFICKALPKCPDPDPALEW